MRSLTLVDPLLDDSSTWQKILREMKSFMKLESLNLGGKFYSTESPGLDGDDVNITWSATEKFYALSMDKRNPDGVLGDRIQDWFLRDGPSPFLQDSPATTLTFELE